MKNSIFRRSLAVILTVAILFATLPMGNIFAATEPNFYDKIVDASSIDGWKEFFPVTSTQNNPLSTENAGGVWTDKSVFTNADGLPGNISMIDGDKNFLTALSAIAANKEIVGYSTIPTDTVLVLDLSGSMSNSNSESALINSANDAISRLLAANSNNRVGVVLYSASGSTGASTYNQSVTRLLPIDRYTTARDNRYISLSGGRVSVDRDVRGTVANADLDNTKSFGGGTYIQAGLYEALQMFEEMDTVIGDNNWQSGDNRMPILVLMSDGACSTGTTDFANVGRSNVGNGNESGLRPGNAFLTQLTASYVINSIEAHYQKENPDVRGLFYTLGFNIGNNAVAQAVMNPDQSTYTDALWTAYNQVIVNPYTGAVNNARTFSVKNTDGGSSDVTIYKNSYANSKSYVDKYFGTSADLATAFKDIVDEIILQSRYYPTHLEGGSPDFSGYVEFTDTLGEYMEVKHISGILLGDTLFDGNMMASKLADTSENGLGTPENPTDLGDEFIWAVQTRLGISNVADARALVAAAYNAGQLSYRSDTDWSNYIGWYANAEGKFIAHWDEAPDKAAPAGAVYKIRSYGFLGETTGSIKNSDMMYMSVQVKTDIATGAETVSWKIPAALVPMVTYLVEVDGNSVDTATNVQLRVEDEDVAPIRLVYETGLRSDLNEFNITRITDEEHIAADGHTRIFWNNYFNIDAPSHDDHVTAMSEFTPNKENERFYYTFDSAVHKKVGNDYQLVTENEGLDVNGTYYHRRYVFSTSSDEPIFFYEQMSKASIQAAIDNGFDDNFESLEQNIVGAWVVPAGTPARELQMYDREKTANPTDSAHMIFHPYLTEQNNTVYVDMNLGNNGLLSVTPATGIKISKTVDIFESGTSDLFKFRLTADTSGTFDSWMTALDATPSGEATKITLAGGAYEFEMRKDQTFWLSGIPAGTAYTVEEISDNADYKIKSVKVNNQSTGLVAAGTVAQYLIDDVQFVNTAVGEGNLVITKQVINEAGNNVDISDSVTFTAEVALTDASGSPVSGSFGNVTVPANGIFTVSLKEGESVILRNIPEETRYTVRETNIPSGFELNTEKSNLSGIVDAAANDQALIVNNYKPTPAYGSEVEVRVSKQISGNRTDWLYGEAYSFTCYRIIDGLPEQILIVRITDNDSEKAAGGTLINDIYTEAGTYNYVIVESTGNQGGITYDTAERRFSVTVADSDMDGDLEIVSVDNVTATTVTEESYGYLVSADFNNVYAPTGAANVTINVTKKMQGDYRLNGFQFALYDGADVKNANEVMRSTVTDSLGNATFSLTYAANGATMAGVVHTYWMAEIDTGNPNITYDDTVYKVEITVKDNGDGTITANPVISGLPAGANGPIFENVFTPSASAYVTLTANKTVEGDRVLNRGEFGFVIEALTQGAPMPSASTVYNEANGAVVFDTIEFDTVGTYKYKIYESTDKKIGGFTYDKRFYEVTVVVTDNGDATLSASVTRVVKKNEIELGRTLADNEIMSFENVYDAKDVSVTLGGTKLLTGKTLQANEFEFSIIAQTQGAPMPRRSFVFNDANGSFTFGEIVFSKAGTYVYEIYEAQSTDPRYINDKSVYTVTVTVTDNSNGILNAKVELKKDNMASSEIVFRNFFTPAPVNYDIYTDFGGEKVLSGRPLEAGEFEFRLINAASGAQIGETVFSDGAGVFKFPAVSLPEAGIYHFKITEVLGDEAGVSYDTSSYHIRLEVVLKDDGTLEITDKRLVKGTLSKEEVGGVLTEVTHYENITVGGSIVFNNTYKASPAYITFTAKKTLTGRDLIDGEFKFDLHKTDSTFAYSDSTLIQDDVVLALDGTDGKITFRPVSFEAVGTYYFLIREDEADEKGITADKTVYEIEVTVTDNGEGRLEAVAKIGGVDITANTAQKVIFNNLYEAAATELVIQGTKTLNGRDIKGGEFSFTLFGRDSSVIETVTNDRDGNFGFTAIPVTEAGTYVYTVKEVIGDEEGMTYDTTVYTVTATVTDNLDGTFKVEYAYSADGIAADDVNFVNSYTDPSLPEIPITGDFDNGIILWIAAFFISGGLLGVTALSRKKSRKE